MLHPVLPPEQPNVVQRKALADVSTGNLSTTKISTLPQDSSKPEKTFKRRDNSSPRESYFKKTQKLSQTSEPEIVLPAEFSSPGVTKKTAPPKENINVAYPLDKEGAQSEGENHFEAVS